MLAKRGSIEIVLCASHAMLKLPWSFSLHHGTQAHSQAYFTYVSSNGKRRDVKPETVMACKLQVYDQPFDRGSYRNVHWALVDGKHHVAKRHMGV